MRKLTPKEIVGYAIAISIGIVVLSGAVGAGIALIRLALM